MVLLRPCTTSAGFMATPERKHRVRMDRLKQRLQEAGYEVVVDARVLLVVRAPEAGGSTESSLHDDGKVLLKTTDMGEAEAAYQALRPHLEATWRT